MRFQFFLFLFFLSSPSFPMNFDPVFFSLSYIFETICMYHTFSIRLIDIDMVLSQMWPPLWIQCRIIIKKKYLMLVQIVGTSTFYKNTHTHVSCSITCILFTFETASLLLFFSFGFLFHNNVNVVGFLYFGLPKKYSGKCGNTNEIGMHKISNMYYKHHNFWNSWSY